MRILLVLSIFQPFLVLSQNILWGASEGKWIHDYGSDVTFDKQGNVYTSGYFPSGGQSHSYYIPLMGSTFFLEKHSPDGNLLWVKLISIPINNGYFDVKTDVDSEDNVYIVGTFGWHLTLNDSISFFDNDGTGYGAGFIIKYSSQGDLLWARKISDDFTIKAVTIDQLDNIYVAGHTRQTYIVADSINIEDPFPDYWPDWDISLVKYTKDGTFEWVRTAATHKGDDYPTTLEMGPDNHIYMGARVDGSLFRYNFGEIDTLNIDLLNSVGSLIFEISNEGELLHKFVVEGNISDMAFDNNTGDLYASGSFLKKMYFDGEIRLQTEGTKLFEGFLAKYNNQKRPVWARKVGQSDFYIDVEGSDIFAVGNVFGVMTVDSFSVYTNSRHMYIAKFNNIGYTQWFKTVPIGNYGRLSSIAVSEQPIRAIAVTGAYSLLTLDLDGLLFTNNSGNDNTDYFLAYMHDYGEETCPDISPFISSDRNELCVGENAIIVAENSFKYPVTWFKGNEVIGEISSGNQIEAKESGNYHFIINDNSNCADTSATVSIRVIDFPDTTLNVTPKMVTCDNENIRINAVADQKYSYHWFKDNKSLAEETQDYLIADSSGIYRVEVTNEGMCKAEAFRSVKILPTENDFLPDTIYHCFNEEVNLIPELNYQGWDYSWSTGETGTSLSILNDGTYTLTINSGLCSYEDKTVVELYENLLPPNVITPNGDGKNDYFVVKKNDMPLALKIYNRWGTMVYENDHYENEWDGNGLNAAVYYYILSDYNCNPNNTIKGYVQLIY